RLAAHEAGRDRRGRLAHAPRHGDRARGTAAGQLTAPSLWRPRFTRAARSATPCRDLRGASMTCRRNVCPGWGALLLAALAAGCSDASHRDLDVHASDARDFEANPDVRPGAYVPHTVSGFASPEDLLGLVGVPEAGPAQIKFVFTRFSEPTGELHFL